LYDSWLEQHPSGARSGHTEKVSANDNERNCPTTSPVLGSRSLSKEKFSEVVDAIPAKVSDVIKASDAVDSANGTRKNAVINQHRDRNYVTALA
jgi:hypothetical protein